MSFFSFYAEVSIGCVCVLMVLLYSIKRLPTPQLKFTLFHRLVLWHALYFLSDSVWAMVNDGVIPKNTFSVLAVNYSNAVILAALFYSCFIYAEMSTRPEMTRMQIRCLQAKLRIPILAEIVLLLISFLTMPDFWLDENLEPRDLYYFILAFIPIVYIMVVTVRCIARGLKPENRQHLKTYLIVASYTPGCIVAGGAQILFSLTTPIFCFWCTLIILFVYLNSQNQLISTDPLTSLNNRNQLHQFLNSKMKKDLGSKRLYLFVIDLDKFKQINDTFGHNEGDRALELVAEVLKAVCGPRGCFIARFGGDEFNIVAELDNDSQANQICEALQAEMHRQAERLNYPLSLSIGYADNFTGAESLPDFFARADKRLYEQKKAKR